VDEVLGEPLGGAHRDSEAMAQTLKQALLRHLDTLEKLPVDKLIQERQQRLASFGEFSEGKA
jgi:acetyl-CoA carboxylase carboxyl transferase subunit alpha